jgi:hypothetical protein
MLEVEGRNPETGTRKETAKPHIVMVSRDPKFTRRGGGSGGKATENGTAAVEPP